MMNILGMRRTIVLSIRGALIKWIDPTWTNYCLHDTELLKQERPLSARGTENSCIILVDWDGKTQCVSDLITEFTLSLLMNTDPIPHPCSGITICFYRKQAVPSSAELCV